MRQIVVIPARYSSNRLPGKPLIDILGVSMIVRTYRCCLGAFPPEDIIVATDDERIFRHCREQAVQVVMTSADLLTGTDRVAEIAQRFPADVYINVQGDDPLTNPQDILSIARESKAHPDAIVNGMTEIGDEELYRSPHIPKVVTRPDGRLLYMSRAPIPANKAGRFATAWRQVCIYAFPRAALLDFAAQSGKTQLEEIEDIEILRFLEIGYDVRMVKVSDRSISIDVPGDILKVEAALRNRAAEGN